MVENEGRKIRVALIHNIISPYRTPLFEGLSNLRDIELKVFYCSSTHKNREWSIVNRLSFDYEVLPGFKIDLGAFTYHINTSIIKEVINGKFDLIIVGGFSDFTTQAAFVLSKLIRIPIIIWSEGIQGSGSVGSRLSDRIGSFFVKSADALIVPGRRSCKYHIQLGVNPRNLFIAHDAVDNSLFFDRNKLLDSEIEAFKKHLSLPDYKISILFVGQLINRKAPDLLLDVYSRLRLKNNNIALIFVGDGPLRAKLKEICDKNKIPDVIFTGWVDERTKSIYYAISDIFVFPTKYDVWGFVVNEAMASGLPIIASETAGCTDDLVLDGVNGYVIKSNDADSLFNALDKMMSDRKRMVDMGKASRNIIMESFQISNSIDGFLQAIKTITLQERLESTDFNNEK